MLSTPPAFVLSQNQTLHRNVSLIWQTDKLTVVKFCLCSNEITGFQIVISDPETSLVSLINFGDSKKSLKRLNNAAPALTYGTLLSSQVTVAHSHRTIMCPARAAAKLITAISAWSNQGSTSPLGFYVWLFCSTYYLGPKLKLRLHEVRFTARSVTIRGENKFGQIEIKP